MSYMALKHIHLTTIAITFALFTLRVLWMLMDSPQLNKKWIRILPHINDTLLLISAIALAVTLQQYPFQAPWLTAKLLGLLAYIFLGLVALRLGKTKVVRGLAALSASRVFFYFVGVALTKAPWPWG